MKHKHVRAVPSIPQEEHPEAPEEYAVTIPGQKILGLTNFHTAQEIAKKINGRIWATITKDGKVDFLYLVG